MFGPVGTVLVVVFLWIVSSEVLMCIWKWFTKVFRISK